MKEPPILFSAPMVRAILEDRKTQTRRVVKFPESWGDDIGTPESVSWCDGGEHGVSGWMFETKKGFGKLAPKYEVGQRLWVRETWQSLALLSKGQYDEGPCYRATGHAANCKCHGHLWRPSIFMPRNLSRITLEVTAVRVERVQDISEEDAKAEGAERMGQEEAGSWEDGGHGYTPGPMTYYSGFQTLWDSINKARGFGWETNPWVWVISFRRVKP